MGTWKPDGRVGKIFVGQEFKHRTKLPCMKWLRDQVPIVELLQTLGLKRSGRYLHCWHPERHKHGDRTPSVGIDVRRNKVHCFVCGFDHSTIDLVMDVKQVGAKAAAEWLAAIWSSVGLVRQQYEISERHKWAGNSRVLTHEWSKLKPKELKKREKGYMEQIIGSPSWRSLTPATAKTMLTLLALTDSKTLSVAKSTRDLAKLIGIRRSAVIRASREIEHFGMYKTDTAYDKTSKKNKTKTYRLTWHSRAWQAWLRGKVIPTTTTKATYITVSQTDHLVPSEAAYQVAEI